MSEKRIRLTARFPAGVSMTVEEVSAVVGPEFAEMHANPPASVLRVRESMLDKQAGTGLYGYTKSTQNDVERATKNLSKQAVAIAQRIYSKDPDVVDFLYKHATRASSPVAAMLLSAMKEIGPKVPDLRVPEGTEETEFDGMAKTASQSRDCDFFKATDGNWYLELQDTPYEDDDGEDHESDDYRMYGPFPSLKNAEKFLDRFSNPGGSNEDDSGSQKPPKESRSGEKLINPSKYRMASMDVSAGALTKNLYGHKTRTASLGIQACGELRLASGQIGSDLHGKRADRQADILGYLDKHASAEGGKCTYSSLLRSGYPELPEQPAPVGEKTPLVKTASEAPSTVAGWLCLKLP